jgi:hypothetical protein
VEIAEAKMQADALAAASVSPDADTDLGHATGYFAGLARALALLGESDRGPLTDTYPLARVVS